MRASAIGAATAVESASMGSTPVTVTSVTGSPAKRNACTTKVSGVSGAKARSSSQAAAAPSARAAMNEEAILLLMVVLLYRKPARTPMLGVNPSVVTSVTSIGRSVRSNWRYHTLLRP